MRAPQGQIVVLKDTARATKKQKGNIMDTKKLKDYLSKIAQLEAEKSELNRDIKQVYMDAEKGNE